MGVGGSASGSGSCLQLEQGKKNFFFSLSSTLPRPACRASVPELTTPPPTNTVFVTMFLPNSFDKYLTWAPLFQDGSMDDLEPGIVVPSDAVSISAGRK